MSSSLQPYGLQPAKFLCPCDSPGKNTAVGCHALLQGVFLTQGWNPGLLLGKWILYRLSHQGRPREISLLTLNQFRQLGLTGHTQAQGRLGNNLKVLKTMKLTFNKKVKLGKKKKGRQYIVC